MRSSTEDADRPTPVKFPQKRMKKQHAGILSMIGFLGATAILGGTIIIIVGVSWDGSNRGGEWGPGQVKIEKVSQVSDDPPCKVECNCTRACNDDSTDTVTCNSTRSCYMCIGSRYEILATSPACPNANLTYTSPCALTAPFIPSSTPESFAGAFIHESCTRLTPRSSFEPYLPRSIRADPAFLIRTGSIVAGIGFAVLCVSLASFFYSESSYELARQQYRASKELGVQ
eukprot:TRINITY_DN965_c2_g2_i1.p1 TRINITY_DN965_c2_g2~~TRINITY_DN965_c2_g2_i1.p1  ORF type:complete len:238 (+),score=7.81 TRINITY_DN965_c2_g2_i1:30-716(+)